MTEPVIVARTATPEGHEIVLTAVRWAKIIEGHPRDGRLPGHDPANCVRT
jgi:hypothetical protein